MQAKRSLVNVLVLMVIGPSLVLFSASLESAFALLEDFNDGKDDGWTPIQGEWEVADGEYCQRDLVWTTTATKETYQRSFFGSLDWKDYTLEAKIKILDGGATAPIAGIFFRVTEISDQSDYYFWRYDLRQGREPALIKAPNVTLIGDQVVGFPTPEFNQEVVLRVEVTDDNIKCFLDDELQFDVNDASFPAGAIGVGTFDAEACFDDILVEGPGIPATAVSWPGKLATTWARTKAGY